MQSDRSIDDSKFQELAERVLIEDRAFLERVGRLGAHSNRDKA